VATSDGNGWESIKPTTNQIDCHTSKQSNEPQFVLDILDPLQRCCHRKSKCKLVETSNQTFHKNFVKLAFFSGYQKPDQSYCPPLSSGQSQVESNMSRMSFKWFRFALSSLFKLQTEKKKLHLHHIKKEQDLGRIVKGSTNLFWSAH